MWELRCCHNTSSYVELWITVIGKDAVMFDWCCMKMYLEACVDTEDQVSLCIHTVWSGFPLFLSLIQSSNPKESQK